MSTAAAPAAADSSEIGPGSTPGALVVLVVGATGLTGRLVVKMLLEMGHRVRIIVRSPDKLSKDILENPNLTVTRASLLDLSDEDLQRHTEGCSAVVSCLGHTMDVTGIWGPPHDLVTSSVARLFSAAETHERPFKFVLMNTVGVANPALHEPRTLSERLILSTLRWTVPPHADNENAARYLHRLGPSSPYGEWVVVRPDSLVDAPVTAASVTADVNVDVNVTEGEPPAAAPTPPPAPVCAYDVMESPCTGIVSGRDTTRANVAHFIASLLVDGELWSTWKLRMPVIMDSLRPKPQKQAEAENSAAASSSTDL